MTVMNIYRLGVLAVSLAAAAAWAQPAIPAEYHTGGFAIGCQAYSFNRFNVFEAIEKTARAGGKVIEFYPGQKFGLGDAAAKWDHNASDADIAKVKAKLAEHKVMAVNYGVVAIPNDEAGARKIFDFVKKMGIRAITTESTESIDLIEKLVKEYDVAVGYHNHPRKDKDPNYKVWDPEYVAGLVKDRDPRIGAAVDTGHWCTSKLEPLTCLKLLKGRIISAHLKDKKAMGWSHDVPYGEGVADIKACLDELKAQGFQGNISIEYEFNWDNNVPEITKCIDFVRNYGAGK